MGDNLQIAKMAVEFWKVIQSYNRSVSLLPTEHQAKTLAQVRFAATRLQSILDTGGLSLITFEGKEFEPNIAATAVNSDDFDDLEVGGLFVAQTVEPAIVHDTNVLLMGKVVLARGN